MYLNEGKMNDYLKRLLATGQLQFVKGKILINGVPMIMQTAYISSYITNMLKKSNEGMSLLYWSGFTQGFMATQFVQNTFKYPKKEDAYKTIVGQSDMLGFGDMKIMRLNVEKPDIVISLNSSLAQEYHKTTC